MTSAYKVPAHPNATTITKQASADSSAKAGKAFKDDSGKATLASAATDIPAGILVEAASTSTAAALTLCTMGRVKYFAGGTIGECDDLTADSAGDLIATTTKGDQIWGVADEDASDGDFAWMTVNFARVGTYA